MPIREHRPYQQPNCNCYIFARCKKRSYAYCLKYGHTCKKCKFDINIKRRDRIKQNLLRKQS